MSGSRVIRMQECSGEFEVKNAVAVEPSLPIVIDNSEAELSGAGRMQCVDGRPGLEAHVGGCPAQGRDDNRLSAGLAGKGAHVSQDARRVRLGQASLHLLRPIYLDGRPDPRVRDGLMLLAASEIRAEPDGDDGTRWVQIAQEGTWLGHSRGKLVFNRGVFEAVIRNNAAKGVETPWDYDHATCNPFASEAPAAGWIKQLAIRETSPLTLWARTEFTARAKKGLAEKEYRYTSLAIDFKAKHHQSGKPMGALLVSVALTNTPFIWELPGVSLSWTAGFIGHGNDKEKNMDWKVLLAAMLGMSADTTDEQLLAAAKERVALADERGRVIGEVFSRLELSATAGVGEAMAKIASLRNPANMVPADRVVALEARLRERDADDLVRQAQAEGKITAAKESVEWFRKLATEHPDDAKAFLLHAPVIIPVRPMERRPGRAGTGSESEGAIELSSADRAVMSQFRGLLTEDDLRKYNTAAYVGTPEEQRAERRAAREED